MGVDALEEAREARAPVAAQAEAQHGRATHGAQDRPDHQHLMAQREQAPRRVVKDVAFELGHQVVEAADQPKDGVGAVEGLQTETVSAEVLLEFLDSILALGAAVVEPPHLRGRQLQGGHDSVDAILDGEMVCLDETGVPRFDWLLHRRHPPSFVAFDIVWLNGRDLRMKPLLERKTALRKIVPTNSPFVLYADFVIERGVALFQAACGRDLEGTIAKKKDEPYADSVRWVKIKNPGYTQAVGRGEEFQHNRRR